MADITWTEIDGPMALRHRKCFSRMTRHRARIREVNLDGPGRNKVARQMPKGWRYKGANVVGLFKSHIFSKRMDNCCHTPPED